MGIGHMNGTVFLLQEAMLELGLPMPLLRVCELGDQRVRIWRSTHKFFQSHRSVIELFGGFYVSIDLNGKFGALPLDLGKPLVPGAIGKELIGSFNLVTNFGTIEHVKEGQCQAFANVHHLCAPDGLIVHCLPHTGFIHGDWQYSPEWVENLAAAQGYDIVSIGVTDRGKVWEKTPPVNRPPGWKSNRVGGTYVVCILRKRQWVVFNQQTWVDPQKAPTPGKIWSKPDGTKQ